MTKAELAAIVEEIRGRNSTPAAVAAELRRVAVFATTYSARRKLFDAAKAELAREAKGGST